MLRWCEEQPRLVCYLVKETGSHLENANYIRVQWLNAERGISLEECEARRLRLRIYFGLRAEVTQRWGCTGC